MMVKKIIHLIMIALLSNIAMAATIHGTVYNFYLEKQQNAVVYLNSMPKQVYVAKNANYFFELPPGNYEINAKYSEGSLLKSEATENVSIGKEGDYVVDIILFPAFNEEEEILNETEQINVADEYFGNGLSAAEVAIFAIMAVALGLVAFLVVRYRKALQRMSKEVEKTAHEVMKSKVTDEAKEILDFIKSQGGRTTQKEVRKHFPSSEAKVSLIISELEHKKAIKKIKKGRGNIIVIE